MAKDVFSRMCRCALLGVFVLIAASCIVDFGENPDPTLASTPVPASSSTPTPSAAPVNFLAQVDAIREWDSLYSEWNFNATAIVAEEGAFGPISGGATITVNGEALNDAMIMYANMNLTDVSPGTAVPFSVGYDETTIADSLSMPDSVTVSAPAGGASFPANGPISVSWSTAGGANAPAFVRIYVNSVFTESGNVIDVVVPYADGSYTIGANTLSADLSPTISVDACNRVIPVNARLLADSYFILANRIGVSVNITN